MQIGSAPRCNMAQPVMQCAGQACACGSLLAPDALFCARCGSRRGAEAPQPAPTQTGAPGLWPQAPGNFAAPPSAGYAAVPWPMNQVAQPANMPPWTSPGGQPLPPVGSQHMVQAGTHPMSQAMMMAGAQQMPAGSAPTAAAPSGPLGLDQVQWSAMSHPGCEQMPLQNFGNAPIHDQASPWPSPLMMNPVQLGETAPSGVATPCPAPPKRRCSCLGDCCMQLRARCQQCASFCRRLAGCGCCRARCSKIRCKCCSSRSETNSSSSSGGGNKCRMDMKLFYQGYGPTIGAAVTALAALGCLLAALIDSPPHLLAAGLSAVLGWLACYAYMLQRDCRSLARNCKYEGEDASAEGTPLAKSPSHRVMAGHGGTNGGQASELDLTMLAGSLGVSFGDGLLGSVGSAPGQGKKGGTMQAVLMAALVNEYLRCASLLRKYQSRHGRLQNAPSCDLGFAEALLAGLSGEGNDAMQPRPVAAVEQANIQAASPTPTRTSPSTSCEAQARSAAEGSPAPIAPPAPASVSSGGNSQNSVNDPPWLQQVQQAHSVPAGREKKVDLDTSVNDPPWLKEIKRAHR
mmetsp:Transcript_167376/g.321486  ORF Transcript_167376/g.321486 Transcript_167376/m.321486 type:complete len:573 (-) Transcript_167376:168-1886(-)